MVAVSSDPRVAQPSAFVRAEFERQQREQGNPRPSSSVIPGVWEGFLPYLSDPSLRALVPSLNDPDVALLAPNGTLVRYTGMVRDMLNPEYFAGAYQSAQTGEWRTTKYEDFADEDLGAARDTVVWERKPLFCVSVAGESDWVRGRQTRPRLGDPASDAPAAPGGEPSRKRPADEEGPQAAAMMDCDDPQTVKRRTEAEGQSKPPCCSGSATNSAAGCCLSPGGDLDAGALVNQSQGDSPCLVKLYDAVGGSAGQSQSQQRFGLEGIKLNDVIEVVGVLGSDPRLALFQSGQAGEGEEVTAEDLANNPPASQVPRLHVICGRRVGCYGELAERASIAANLEALRASRERVEASRAKTLDYLSRSVGGDRLAAEYLLLHLLAHCRRDGGSPSAAVVGKHSLNLVGGRDFSALDCEAILRVVGSLVPRIRSLPVSLRGLNAGPLWPRKDYRVSRLVGGPLLLADQTHLFLDETQLGEGQLGQCGVQNFQALKGLVENQQVEVDFQFYRLPVPCDVPVTVLSRTKSLLPCDTCVHVARIQGQQHTELPSETELDELRSYIVHCWMLDYSIPDTVSEVLQQDFVLQRQKDPSTVGAEHLHRTLTLARLLSASRGETSLSVETYRALGELEEKRRARAGG